MAQEVIVLPKGHFRKRVNQQYARPWVAIGREILQNSQDAGASVVYFTLDEGKFSAIDDGCGMTLEEFRRFYLTLGGTKKETGSIGGFGAAKELLSFAWENWTCKGQNFRVDGSGAAAPESAEGEEAGIPEGFLVAAEDEDILGDNIAVGLDLLCRRSNLNTKVYIEIPECSIMLHSPMPKGRSLRSNQVVREWEWGTLYVHKSGPNHEYRENTGELYVRTRGLFTGTEFAGGDYVYYLELDAASPEVLTENRDGLRYEIKRMVDRELSSIIQSPSKVESTPNPNPRLTLYGEYDIERPISTGSESDVYNNERGSFELFADGRTDLWRKPFAVADESKEGARLETSSGNPRPAYTHALEVWDKTMALVAGVTGLDRPMVGLFIGEDVNAMHTIIGDKHIICVNPDGLEGRSPYDVLDMAIHEFAHYARSGHSQEFERERRRLARDVGGVAPAILDSIRKEKRVGKRRGRYWEDVA